MFGSSPRAGSIEAGSFVVVLSLMKKWDLCPKPQTCSTVKVVSRPWIGLVGRLQGRPFMNTGQLRAMLLPCGHLPDKSSVHHFSFPQSGAGKNKPAWSKRVSFTLVQMETSDKIYYVNFLLSLTTGPVRSSPIFSMFLIGFRFNTNHRFLSVFRFGLRS